MDINLETLLIALGFILPGFLTSRLIQSRTPATEKQPNPFVETSESLLRSIFIHLIIAIPVLIFLHLNKSVISQISQNNLEDFAKNYPLQTSTFIIGWFVVAFVLAGFFGFRWDPLDRLYQVLSLGIGLVPSDIWHQLRQEVEDFRKQSQIPREFWIQVELKNGKIYQGEFQFVSFHQNEQGRELLLRNVTAFYTKSSETTDPSQIREDEQVFDAVILDLANSESIEVMFHDPATSRELPNTH